MNLSRNLIQGAAGGFFGAAWLGVIEAGYLFSTQGAPDLIAPAYAFVLYSLIGLPLGLGGGVVLSVLEKMRLVKVRDEAFALSWGTMAGVSPMLLFICYYLANKVVYAEQGVPKTGLAAIVVLVGVYAVAELTVGLSTVRGPLKFLTRGPGLLGGYLVSLVALIGLSFTPVGDDPRANFASGRGVPAELSEAPNVLVLTIDTLRADYLGAYGHEAKRSPTLDAIAADGVLFEQAFAHASWTRSSFASLWSSRLPSSHNADTKAARLPDELELLSEVLHDAGVTTGNLANNINVTSTFNFDQGYDTFIYEVPDYPFGATESVFSLTFYKVVHKLNERLGGAKAVGTFYQPAEVVLGDAKAFIQANQDARWMLGVHLMEPHDPYFEHPYIDGSGKAEFNGVGYARAEHEHPDPAKADYLKQVYLDEIDHMDRKLETFVDWLKSEGLYDDLMIVITADHGEEFNEHGGFWHGTTLYEEQIHIPLIIKLPGNEFAGTREAWQARSIDVAPTITAALGVSPSEQWVGTDLMTTTRTRLETEAQNAAALEETKAALVELEEANADVEDAEAWNDEALALRDSYEAKIEELTVKTTPCTRYEALNDRVHVAEEDFEGNILSAIRVGGFKYMTAQDGNPRGLPTQMLFDMVEDRAELKNLMGKDRTICGRELSSLPTSLQSDLEAVISGAEATGVETEDVEIDEAEKLRLCELGYLSGPDCE